MNEENWKIFLLLRFLGPQKEGRAGPDQNQSITRGHESWETTGL